MAITRKILVGISSNFLHSIRTSNCIRKCNKNWGWFQSQFLENHGLPWTIVHGFPKIGSETTPNFIKHSNTY